MWSQLRLEIMASVHALDRLHFAAWLFGMASVALVLRRRFQRPDSAFKSHPAAGAYLVVAFVPVIVTSLKGLRGWMQIGDLDREDRIGMHIPDASDILEIQIAYQIFSIVAGLLIGPPMNSAPMLAHHVCTLLITGFNLGFHVHYHVLYFGGCIEFSNWPLGVMDLFKRFPAIAAKYPKVSLASRIAFAGSFTVLRVILWLWYDITFVGDSLHLILYHSHTMQNPFAVYISLIGNVFITGLQLFWFTKIVRRVLTLSGRMRS